MAQILRDIYNDVAIAPLLGFKGGTCAYFFYGLPRFSVDLDFDLLSEVEADRAAVLARITEIMEKYGTVKDRRVKRYTVFALLSYGGGDHNIKVEINTRRLAPRLEEKYELKESLGMSMLVAKQDYMFAGKLLALTSRKGTAMRDVYDIRYFAANSWSIDSEVISGLTGRTVKEYLADCIAFIKKIKDSQTLQGLGELVGGAKEKAWVKSSLKKDVIFLLENYRAAGR